MVDSTIRSEAAGNLDTPHGTSPASAVETSSTESQSDTQTLISAVQALRKTSLEQSTNLKACLDRLSTAVEAQNLKEQPRSNDKKTAFWTVYKKLADEFDKELHDKYVNDFDASLLFAGLFSAVSSAFIIQIQVELLPDSNATTQALLMLLVQNMTGAAAPAIQMFVPTAPETRVVAAQGLLYCSLFSTLFAALLAVLGKQWILYYDSVGEKGTIVERGLERQTKFDALQRWHFDLIMQIYPLLLQFSLLLFAMALSIYLWTIHPVLAGISIALTSLGFVVYTLMIFSALAHRDSPFQTSLTTLLTLVVEPESLHNFVERTGRRMQGGRAALRDRLTHACAGFTKTLPPLLPLSDTTREPKSPPSRAIFPLLPPPSEEVPAIVWAVETSTHPVLVEAAATVIPDLQWPVNIDLRPALRRLCDIVDECLDGTQIRDGMGDRAITCIKAFAVLKTVSKQHPNQPLPRVQNFAGLTRMLVDLRALDVQWTMRFTHAKLLDPTLEEVLDNFRPDESTLQSHSIFADFLFFMNSFFGAHAVEDLALVDKSPHCVLLTTHLFHNLAQRLTDVKLLDSGTADRILRHIVKFKDNLKNNTYIPGDDSACRNAAYQLCAVSPGIPQSTLTRVLEIVRLPSARELDPVDPLNSSDIKWVYRALERLWNCQDRDIDAVGDLLQVILYSIVPVRSTITADALRTILWGIQSDADDGRTRAFGFRVLCSTADWFTGKSNNELRSVLPDHAIWTLLGTCSALNPSAYIGLGDKLSTSPEWKAALAQDPLGWFSYLPVVLDVQYAGKTRAEFRAVLARVWRADADLNADAAEDETSGDFEKTLVMGLAALTNVWDQCDFSKSRDVRRLVQCTVRTAFCAGSWVLSTYRPLAHEIVDRLVDAVERAVKRAREEVGRGSLHPEQDLKYMVNDAAEILSKLAGTIKDELKDGPSNDEDQSAQLQNWLDLDNLCHLVKWSQLQQGFEDDIKALPVP